MSFFSKSPNQSCQYCHHDDPFTMNHHAPFSNFHSQNTISTPNFPNFPNHHFPPHNSFSEFHSQNTISTPQFPNFPPFPQFPMHHNMPMPPFGGGPLAAWEETPAGHVLKVDIPAGLKKDDVNFKVEQGKVLKISGEKKMEKKERYENGHHMESSSGKFMKTCSLPENCKPEHVTTSFENGVLKVTVPKKDVVKNHAHVMNIQLDD